MQKPRDPLIRGRNSSPAPTARGPLLTSTWPLVSYVVNWISRLELDQETMASFP